MSPWNGRHQAFSNALIKTDRSKMPLCPHADAVQFFKCMQPRGAENTETPELLRGNFQGHTTGVVRWDGCTSVPKEMEPLIPRLTLALNDFQYTNRRKEGTMRFKRRKSRWRHLNKRWSKTIVWTIVTQYATSYEGRHGTEALKQIGVKTSSTCHHLDVASQ